VGHDFHFLSRLERVEGSALDLALGLYRDPKLLRWALNILPPGGAEVVALPLTPAPEPPYALVSRKGKFITCLGEGMQPGGTEVIRWEQLDGARGEWQNISALLAKGKNRGLLVYKRMLSAGPWLSREDYHDFQVIASLHPRVVAEVVANGANHWLDLRDRTRVRDFQRLDDTRKAQLSRGWKAAWSSAHALFGMVEATLQARTLRCFDVQVPNYIEMAGLVAEVGTTGLLLRAAWALARLGPITVGELIATVRLGLEHIAMTKRGEMPDETIHVPASMLLVSIFALVGIASQHIEVRPEVVEFLREHSPRPDDPIPRGDGAGLLLLFQAGLHLLQEPDAGIASGHPIMDQIARDFITGADLPPQLRHIPPTLAIGQYLLRPEGLPGTICLMPSLACQTSEDLFFPQAWLQTAPTAVPIERIRDLLVADARSIIQASHRRAQRSAPQAGRNEACPCGSGRKYKKCCGK
jgi:hypothetical protein